MDKKQAEYLRGIALQQQHKAFEKWHNLPASTPEKLCEAARMECAAWAKAANELYQEAHKQEEQVKA